VDSDDARQGLADKDRHLSSCCHSTSESHIPGTGAALIPSRGTTPTRTGRIANELPFSRQNPLLSSPKNDDHGFSVLAHGNCVQRIRPLRKHWSRWGQAPPTPGAHVEQLHGRAGRETGAGKRNGPRSGASIIRECWQPSYERIRPFCWRLFA
jgi:hypothetical protein